tara:strand:+ start:1069 stop:1662 length:594 start_codon:yes stop_codon:yes gene_type:complete
MYHDWCWVDSGLSKLECDKIVYAGEQQLVQASVGTANDQRLDERVRKGKVSFFNSGDHPDADPHIERALQAFTSIVHEFWGYQITDFEAPQFTSYKRGDKYNWHVDCGDKKFTRNFSASLELSSPEDYSGGGLEFIGLNNNRPDRKLGRMVIFPSGLTHRARRVISGKRSALVIWASANVFQEPENLEAKFFSEYKG